MITHILILTAVTVVKWLVYTGLLWGMIRVQHLNYNVPGLFASSLAAVLAAFIPFVGTYAAYVVLVLCLWKCTGAEIVPDVVFTVAIAGALMFCVNLFVIGALMGEVRPNLGVNARLGGTNMLDYPDGEEPEDTDNEATAAIPVTNGATSLRPLAGSAPVDPQPGRRTSKKRTKAKAENLITDADPGRLAVKGVSYNATRPSVLIFDGSRTHTVSTGDVFMATLAIGRRSLRCLEIREFSVVLRTDKGEQFVLPMP
jgi:hypothetical protein